MKKFLIALIVLASSALHAAPLSPMVTPGVAEAGWDEFGSVRIDYHDAGEHPADRYYFAFNDAASGERGNNQGYRIFDVTTENRDSLILYGMSYNYYSVTGILARGIETQTDDGWNYRIEGFIDGSDQDFALALASGNSFEIHSLVPGGVFDDEDPRYNYQRPEGSFVIGATDQIYGVDYFPESYFEESQSANVSEPVTLALFGLGLIGVFCSRRKTKA